jgi:hypothetical protein
VPEAFVSAQQSTQRTAHSAPASKSASALHATHNTNRNGHHVQHRHGNVPPWSNSVYVNGGNAAQYLATSKPKPPPGKNKVNTGGEVFKSISN